MKELFELTALGDVTWKMVVMWFAVALLLYLAIKHQFEPMLLVPIAFGALLANLPTEGIINAPTSDHAG